MGRWTIRRRGRTRYLRSILLGLGGIGLFLGGIWAMRRREKNTMKDILSEVRSQRQLLAEAIERLQQSTRFDPEPVVAQLRIQGDRLLEVISALLPQASPEGVPPESVDRCPPDYPIKGNIRPDGTKLYHIPGQPSYEQTHPERCFANEADAQQAGYRSTAKHVP
jgi:hypothetical protein